MTDEHSNLEVTQPMHTTGGMRVDDIGPTLSSTSMVAAQKTCYDSSYQDPERVQVGLTRPPQS